MFAYRTRARLSISQILGSLKYKPRNIKEMLTEWMKTKISKVQFYAQVHLQKSLGMQKDRVYILYSKET